VRRKVAGTREVLDGNNTVETAAAKENRDGPRDHTLFCGRQSARSPLPPFLGSGTLWVCSAE
jgi:hypothetical protein